MYNNLVFVFSGIKLSYRLRLTLRLRGNVYRPPQTVLNSVNKKKKVNG